MRVPNNALSNSPVKVDPASISELSETLISVEHKHHTAQRGTTPTQQGSKATMSEANDDAAASAVSCSIDVNITKEHPEDDHHRPIRCAKWCYRSRRLTRILSRRQLWFLVVLLLLVGLRCSSIVWWALNYTPTTATKTEWTAFSHDYHQRFGRSPPLELQQWLAYAKRQKCETRQYYNSIDQQLKVFRTDPNSAAHYSLDDIVDEATSYTNGFVVFSLNENKLTIDKMQDNDSAPDFGGRPWWLAKAERYYKEWALRWLLQPVVDHQPPISTKFVWNIMDEPADDPKFPIFSACGRRDDWANVDITEDNQTHTVLPLLSTSQGHERSRESEVSVPETQVRDLLIPYHFSIGSIGTRGGDGNLLWSLVRRMTCSNQAWRDRENAITWRGSTTGAWGTGPRFHLVNMDVDGMSNPDVWNRKNVSTVHHDFAFVKVIQEPVKELDPKYRTGGHMSYKEMQNFKYVLDVDGNCECFNDPVLVCVTFFKFWLDHLHYQQRPRPQPFQSDIPNC